MERCWAGPRLAKGLVSLILGKFSVLACALLFVGATAAAGPPATSVSPVGADALTRVESFVRANPEGTEGIVYLDGMPTVQVKENSGSISAARVAGVPVVVVRNGVRDLLRRVDALERELRDATGVVSIGVNPVDDVIDLVLDARESTLPNGSSSLTAAERDPAVRIIRDGVRSTAAVVSTIAGWSQNGCTSGINAIRNGVEIQLWAGHCMGYPLGRQFSNGTGNLGVSISNFISDGGYDVGIVRYNAGVWAPPQVADRNGGLIYVRGVGNSYGGMPICKYGVTTGETCGYITGIGVITIVTYDMPGYGKVTWKTRGQILTTACVEQGDSGGPLMSGQKGRYVVGLTTSTPGGSRCGYNSGFRSAYSASGTARSGFSDMVLTLWQYGQSAPTALKTSNS